MNGFSSLAVPVFWRVCVYIYIYALPTACSSDRYGFSLQSVPSATGSQVPQNTHTEKDPFQGPPVRENMAGVRWREPKLRSKLVMHNPPQGSIMHSQPLAAPTATDFPCNPCPLQQAVKCTKNPHRKGSFSRTSSAGKHIPPSTHPWLAHRYSVAAWIQGRDGEGSFTAANAWRPLSRWILAVCKCCHLPLVTSVQRHAVLVGAGGSPST